MEDILRPNEFWALKRMGPRYYTATRNDGEHRIYYSLDALRMDFGRVEFPEKSGKEDKEDLDVTLTKYSSKG